MSVYTTFLENPENLGYLQEGSLREDLEGIFYDMLRKVKYRTVVSKEA